MSDYDWLFPVVFGSLAVGFALWKTLQHSTSRSKAETWRRASDKLGGKFVESGGTFSTEYQIEATIDGVAIWVTLVDRRAGNTRARCTEVHATTSSQHLDLGIYRPLRMSPTGMGLLGGRPLIVGDPAFDGRFTVRTNDDVLARSWLDERARMRLLRTEDYAFEISDCGIRGAIDGVETDDVRLVSACEAVAALAKGGLGLLDTIDHVAQSLGGITERRTKPEAIGGFEVALRHPAGEVLFDLVHQETGKLSIKAVPWTRLRVAVTGTRTPFVAVHRQAPRDALEVEGLTAFTVADEAVDQTYRFESADPSASASVFDAALCRRLMTAAPTIVADDGQEATVILAGLDADEETLRANVELLLALAGSGTGPYR